MKGNKRQVFIHNILNANEVMKMAWTANALAKKLSCAWVTVRKAIAKGELEATFDSERRAWLIEDGLKLTLFRARLDYLRQLRRERAERMRKLWKAGKLRPRQQKRGQVQVIERLKRPSIVTVGEGVHSRTSVISWHGEEGSFCCPCCAASLRVR